VKQVRSDVEKIFRHHQKRCLVAQDVAQQLEQRKHQQEHQECGKNHSQVDEEIAQHVIIQQGRKACAKNAAARGGALEGVGAVAPSQAECGDMPVGTMIV